MGLNAFKEPTHLNECSLQQNLIIRLEEDVREDNQISKSILPVRNIVLFIVDNLKISTLSGHLPTCVASMDSLYNWTALIWLSTHANSPVQRGFPEMESVLKLWLLFVFSLNCCCSYKSRHCRHKQCCLPI